MEVRAARPQALGTLQLECSAHGGSRQVYCHGCSSSARATSTYLDYIGVDDVVNWHYELVGRPGRHLRRAAIHGGPSARGEPEGPGSRRLGDDASFRLPKQRPGRAG